MVANEQTPDLRVGLSYKQILQMALPISAAILVPQINFVTNNIFLGTLGESALAVAGITGIFYMIFAVIGQGLNTGLQSLLSRKAGAQQTEQIAQLFNEGQLIALVMSVLGIATVWLLAPIVLRSTMHDPTNVDMAVNFLQIRILGLPLLYMYLMRNALLVSTQQTKLLIIGTATEALFNVFFDYVLINGKWGFPQMGFNGAAVASIIAELAGLLSVMVVLKKNAIIKQLKISANIQWPLLYLPDIVKQAAPIVLQYVLSIISWEIFYILIEHHGSRALAISNTMRNIFGFFGCFTWALAATTNSMVSNVVGQGLYDKVFELIGKIMRLSLGFSAIVCGVINLFPHAILSVYGQGEAFVNDAIPVLQVVSSAMMLMSVSVVWLNAVTGSGNPNMNLLTEICAIVVYIIYVYTVLEVYHLPITFGWASEWLYWGVMLVPSYWFMQSNRWQKKYAKQQQDIQD